MSAQQFEDSVKYRGEKHYPCDGSEPGGSGDYAVYQYLRSYRDCEAGKCEDKSGQDKAGKQQRRIQITVFFAVLLQLLA